MAASSTQIIPIYKIKKEKQPSGCLSFSLSFTQNLCFHLNMKNRGFIQQSRMQFELKKSHSYAKANHTPPDSCVCRTNMFFLHVLQTHMTYALKSGPHLNRSALWLRFLPLLVVISAWAFPTHCKTKTTPTRRSNVFTPAISKLWCPLISSRSSRSLF